VKRYKLRLSPDIAAAIDAQVVWIARESIDRALGWERRLSKAIDGARTWPGTHPIDNAASARIGRLAHKLVFERNYLIVYAIDESTTAIELVGFRHVAKQPGPKEP